MPPPANERALAPIGGTQRLKHHRQTLVGEIGDIIGSFDFTDNRFHARVVVVVVDDDVIIVIFAGYHRRNQRGGSGFCVGGAVVALAAFTAESNGRGR